MTGRRALLMVALLATLGGAGCGVTRYSEYQVPGQEEAFSPVFFDDGGTRGSVDINFDGDWPRQNLQLSFDGRGEAPPDIQDATVEVTWTEWGKTVSAPADSFDVLAKRCGKDWRCEGVEGVAVARQPPGRKTLGRLEDFQLTIRFRQDGRVVERRLPVHRARHWYPWVIRDC